MTWGFADVTLSPLLPWPWIAGPAAVFAVLAAIALARRARGAWWRILPLAAILLALLNPRLAGEERAPLDDVAVVVVDHSQSQSVGQRSAQADQALAELSERLARLPNLEVRVEHVRPPPGQDEGTRMFAALNRALSDVPRRRLAGVLMITDGQVHDVPEGREAELGAPLHVLLTGGKDERDRRLVVEQAPAFGIVGSPTKIVLRVDEPGAQGTARVTVRRDGGRSVTMVVPLNAARTVEVPVDHGGPTVIELEAEAGPNELTLANNRTAVTVNGVRDRLRVLLVSGEPHPGERTWRNLLKADPSVDLVHFTILRPPEKDDATPIRELALISFPIRELFEERLKDFDLIIFDRYRRRSLMPLDYYQNIADYVRGGGALLMAVGPEAADGFDLHATPLETVLPARPDGDLLGEGYLPLVTDLGRRHPVTAGLPGADGPKPNWGRWLRLVSTARHSGLEVMSGAQGRPLLVLDHVGDGRVAQLLSDTVWLWARGYEGGGPQAELLRRLAHWLMKEPALEEETLRAEVQGEQLLITRRSLTPGPAQVTVTLPDERKQPLTLADQGDGRATAALPLEQAGLYRVTDGSKTAVTAAGSLNPLEMADLAATDKLLKPVAEANGGAVAWLSDGLPELRRVGKDDRTVGRNWLGLRANGEHVVTAIRDVPLMPATLLLLLTLGGLIMAWWREGR